MAAEYHVIHPRSELWINAYPNQEVYREGDELAILLEGDNRGPAVRVDVYVFFDHSGTYFSMGRFTIYHVPWLVDILVPAGSHFDSGEIFRLELDQRLASRIAGFTRGHVLVCSSGTSFISGYSSFMFMVDYP